MNDNNNLYLMPIKFNKFKDIGNTSSSRLNNYYYLSKLITQNILYAVYHQPLSIDDIAAKLAMPPNTIEQIIHYLEDSGDIIKVTNDKYLTTILIHDLSKNVHDSMISIYQKYAKIIVNEYFKCFDIDIIKQLNRYCTNGVSPSTVSAISDRHIDGGTPSVRWRSEITDTINFMKWCIFTLAITKKFYFKEHKEKLLKHYTKRNDGTQLITMAIIENGFNDILYKKHDTNYGSLEFTLPFIDDFPCYLWMFNSVFDNRVYNWNYYLRREHVYLYDYLKKNLTDIEQNSEKFRIMHQNGILINNSVNMMVTNLSLDNILEILPPIPDCFKDINHSIAKETFNIAKGEYPEHLQGLVSDLLVNALDSYEMVVAILYELLNTNILEQLKDYQKLTVNMILFSDILLA